MAARGAPGERIGAALDALELRRAGELGEALARQAGERR
jgi:hypothetical protein